MPEQNDETQTFLVTIPASGDATTVSIEKALRNSMLGSRFTKVDGARVQWAEVQWVAVNYDTSIDHEYGCATDDVWGVLESELLSLPEDEGVEWLTEPPGEWDIDQRRSFIRHIVQKMGYIGNNGCDLAEAVVALGWARVVTD